MRIDPMARQGKDASAWSDELECMKLEDELVNALSGPGWTATSEQAAAASALAASCARRLEIFAISLIAARDRTPIFHVNKERLRRACGSGSAAVPDASIMQRLEKIVGDVRPDVAAVAAINAAQWVLRWHKRGQQLPN